MISPPIWRVVTDKATEFLVLDYENKALGLPPGIHRQSLAGELLHTMVRIVAHCFCKKAPSFRSSGEAVSHFEVSCQPTDVTEKRMNGVDERIGIFERNFLILAVRKHS